MRIKVILFIVLYTALHLSTEAQDVSESAEIKYLGVSGSASVMDHTVRVQLEPYLAWGSNTHQLLLGPTLLLATNIGFKTHPATRLSGLRIGYRYLPPLEHRKLTFYLSADFRMQRVKDQWEANIFNEQLGLYQDITYRTVEFLLENQLGYGLNYKLVKSLSISHGVGLGWYLSDLNTKVLTPGVTQIDNADFRGYDNFGLSLNVRLGIIYNIKGF